MSEIETGQTRGGRRYAYLGRSILEDREIAPGVTDFMPADNGGFRFVILHFTGVSLHQEHTPIKHHCSRAIAHRIRFSQGGNQTH